MLIFSGSSHRGLALEIASHLGVELGKCSVGKFPDGEIQVQILETVRGLDVFVVQTLAYEPNDYLMELLIMIDALKRASAKSIVAVIPYFGYARQDRIDKPRVPITAKLVATMLQSAGATRVLTMDLHAEQIQGFFDIPVDNLYARPILTSSLLASGFKDFAVVAPDLGSVNRARFFAASTNASLAFINKQRMSSTEVLEGVLIGEVRGKNVVLVDDLCSTAKTLTMAADVCKRQGARHIIAGLSHGLFVDEAEYKLQNSPIEKLFVSNTVNWLPLLKGGKLKVEAVSVADLFAKAIDCVIKAKSISSLFS